MFGIEAYLPKYLDRGPGSSTLVSDVVTTRSAGTAPQTKFIHSYGHLAVSHRQDQCTYVVKTGLVYNIGLSRTRVDTPL